MIQSYKKVQWGEIVGCTFHEGDIVHIHWSTSSPFELDVTKVCLISSTNNVVLSSSTSAININSTTKSELIPNERNMVPIQYIQLLYTNRDKETQLSGIFSPDSPNCYIYDTIWSSSSSSSSITNPNSNVIMAPLVLDPGLGSYAWPLTKTSFLRNIYRKKGFCIHSTGTRLLSIQSDFQNFHISTMIQQASRITVWMKNILNQKMQYIDNVPPEIALACYRSGHSLYFNPSHDIQKKYIKSLCKDLGMDFGLTMLNDASPGGDIEIFAVQGKHSTPWHFDGQENFTIQLVGTKRWRFCPSQVTDPLTNLHPSSTNITSIEDDIKVHHSYCTAPLDVQNVPGIRHYQQNEQTIKQTLATNPTSTSSHNTISSPNTSQQPHDQVTTVVLRPGSILYVPAGWWHAVDSEDDEGSLSMNFSISGGRWNDFFLRRFIQLLWNQPEWRERITVPSGNIEETRNHFTNLLNKLPTILQEAQQGSKNSGTMYLPDALFDQYKSKKIIIKEEYTNNNSTTTTSSKYARVDTTHNHIEKKPTNIKDPNEDNTNDIEEYDDDDDDDTEPILYSYQIQKRNITNQTILRRNPLHIMVIKGTSNNPTVITNISKKRSRSSSNNTINYIHIEIHSGFGSIAAESFLSDSVSHIYVPYHLLPVIQYMEKLAAYPNSNSSSSTSTSTADTIKNTISLIDCYNVLHIATDTTTTNNKPLSNSDNDPLIIGLLNSLCHTGYFHDI